MAMNLGAIGQICGLCGLPVGAPSGIVVPGQVSGNGVTCSGHSAEQALQIMFGRVAKLEGFVGMLLQEHDARQEAEADHSITVSVPDGVDPEDVASMVSEQILDEIHRDDT